MHLNLFYYNKYNYMCGIIGIYNKSQGEVSELISCLKKLLRVSQKTLYFLKKILGVKCVHPTR